ncbi:outer membrane beta-barrel protein [Flavobacterium lindanitolerans]|uniref:Outer membrane receptor protein involved in Fe transport n=1 Tax=Flavobacterium lindanitolerans TaxID=428988 RepID=A0A497V356_9FLAO|nr:outer membrane beta-barrel protein [Flavobacterium lindanitolerans]PKW29534.1 outer membrane receptor protein involved in Fe transport [Flavobacterium lindanitolerans]RLJ34965.1 outer membrane receptor protein involved in Fe transport [Flavobacterium lindanitolerans]
MLRTILPVLFVLLSCAAFGQNSFTIKGKAISKEVNLPLESATIYITAAKDSTVIDYTISNKNGNFSISVKKLNQPFIVKVASLGYQTWEKEFPKLTSDIDMGEIFISDAVTTLGEVEIVSEAPPIRIKNDTLEFNASSFKVRPDSNVEALLKQLPGVEIDKDGKIKVNGKEVNEILVNGKSFFGKDGKVAIKNLPSEIVDKIQVSDTKTKEEKLSGDAASSDNKSINITIQEDKNKGLFGKFTGGYGTDKRYESSGLVNYFKDKQKISILASSNNINSVGFSMDEIFDAMGGGRNFYSNSNGSFGIDGMNFGGNEGITQSSMIGLNFADEWFKKLEPNGSYFYTNSKTDNDTRSRTENFLTSENGTNSSFITESSGTTRRTSDGHNFNLELEYKINPSLTLSVRPSLVKNNSESKNFSEQSSTNDLGLVNESTNSSKSNNASSTFGNELYLHKKFKRKGRNFGFTFNNTNKSNDKDNITNSETYFFQDPDRTEDIRRQRVYDDEKDNTYYTRIGYSEPITDSLSITIRGSYEWKDYDNTKSTFNQNASSGQYSEFNNLLSYGLMSKTRTFNPGASFNVRKSKYSGGMTLGTKVIRMENTSQYDGTTTHVDKNYVYPSANAWFNYRLSKSKSFYMYYNFDVQLPTAAQILPVVDLTNPLFQISGNPDLNPTKNHSLHLNYNNYDYASKSGFYLYAGFNYYEQQIVFSRVFNPVDLINRADYQNINDTYNSYGGASWSKSIKREQHTFRFDIGANANYNLNKGLTNNALYEARGLGLSPQVRIAWDYGELLTIEPSYTYTWNKTNYENYSVSSSSNFTHNFKIQTTSHWPKHFVFGNDFGYTYNSNISDGYKKDFYLLNTSLGYNFMEDKLLLKVKVYDVLNQNQSAVRYINPESIEDIQNTVLKRYAMFSLTYKIEKFGGKKKEGNSFSF